ncbi:MAG: hypothetical protein NTW04_03450, partial [Elusimicrobia bacterium]|nr:hypothetical protein [Elusimicrobiota bacterium]
IKEIKGINEIQTLKSYHSHVLSCAVGERAIPTRNLYETLCIVWLANNNEKTLRQDAARAHELFKIIT